MNDFTNFITEIMNLKDLDAFDIIHLPSDDGQIILQIEHKPTVKTCPLCGFRMHSKGIYTRTVRHPLLVDNRIFTFKLRQRKWLCQNPDCCHFETDSFPFIGKSRRITDYVDFLIVQEFRDFNLSAVQIAEKYKVSDTYALSVFDRYVDLPRLKLPSALCVDEVHMNIDKYKYALILQDFASGEPVDIVISRRKEITEPYFASIPKEERFSVKYIISDMYAPYQKYVDTYFPKAIPVIDAFHVIKMINHKLNIYLNRVRKKYKDRDIRLLEEKQKSSSKKLVLHESRKLYLLRTKKWLILSNQDKINYNAPPFRDWRFNNTLMTVSDYERALFDLDPDLEILRNLKEKYITFNNQYSGNPDGARTAIDEVIQLYRDCGYPMFEEVAEALTQYKSAIINSFILLSRKDRNGHTFKARLSNGPMESLNRIPKDMKRHARGYTSFAHIRNRFLFSTRENAPILASPKKSEDVKNITGKTRGSYRKHGGKKNEN